MLKKINANIYMSGTGASNLGYGNITPGSNINSTYVNVHNSHDPANFTSREISGFPGLSGSKWNVDAAKGYDPGICLWKGGKSRKRNNKSIVYRRMRKTTRSRFTKKKYGGSHFCKKKGCKHVHTTRCTSHGCMHVHQNSNNNMICRHIHTNKCNKYGCKHVHTNSCRKKKSLKGGYAQYQNNLPLTPVYSTGGVLNSNQLALANPVPHQALSNCVNCKDNYNHYTGTGSPSRGH